jgi:hypothetical protein
LAAGRSWLVRMIRQHRSVVALTCVLLLSSAVPPHAAEPATEEEKPPAAATAEPPSKVKSPEDGWFDVSGFLDEAYGFVPLLIPITEPAVGFGAAGALMFIDKPEGDWLGRANITAVGGLGTANGTTGLMAGDVRHFHDNHFQTMVGVISASVNLDFHGVGDDARLKDDPLDYTIEPLGGMARLKYRFGESHVWAGIGYALAVTDVRFDDETDALGVVEFEDESRVGGLLPSVTYDSRDNIFTPTRGLYIEGSAGLFGPALGGDDSFQRASVIAIAHVPIQPRLILGVKTDGLFTFGDTPFYLLPFVGLRGAPMMRYQGEEVAQIETEVRWQFWKRFSVVGFVGGGVAWNDFAQLDDRNAVVTGGTGFRYELAREYGIHAGLDVAFGPDGTAIYVQFGSAWTRP